MTDTGVKTVGARDASDADMEGSAGLGDWPVNLVDGAVASPLADVFDNGFVVGDGKPGDDAMAW